MQQAAAEVAGVAELPRLPLLTPYSTLHDDEEADVDLPELDPDVPADPEHLWDIATMTVKEALAGWNGKAMKAAMDEEIRSLIANGTWELVERPRSINIMKIMWVLMTKYHVNDTVARENVRLVIKGFAQVYGADYDETYAPVGSYVTPRRARNGTQDGSFAVQLIWYSRNVRFRTTLYAL
ncbi:unnamed protein product [Closterium sp. NIES-53]